jgi:hypothetical protein
MLTFEWDPAGSDMAYNRMVVKDEGKIIDILEREDNRDNLLAKISLMGIWLRGCGAYRTGKLSFNDSNLDRFLFT